MKEQAKVASEVRDRISPCMADLYDIVIEAYKKQRLTPEFQGVLDENGEVYGLTFNNVPQKVMSRIFVAFMKQKDSASCGFALEAGIKKEDKDFTFSVQITRDKI